MGVIWKHAMTKYFWEKNVFSFVYCRKSWSLLWFQNFFLCVSQTYLARVPLLLLRHIQDTKFCWRQFGKEWMFPADQDYSFFPQFSQGELLLGVQCHSSHFTGSPGFLKFYFLPFEVIKTSQKFPQCLPFWISLVFVLLSFSVPVSNPVYHLVFTAL